MRKKIINSVAQETTPFSEKWLDLEGLSQVEITSESAGHPVESALTPGSASGWRAAQPGEQTIRLVFDKPLSLRRILLKFIEKEQVRTQEFALRWIPEGDEHAREIVRQQYTFAPPGTIEEIEDYRVELNGVKTLELKIVPHIGGGSAYASLAQLSLA
jgi:hypothetical protein